MYDDDAWEFINEAFASLAQRRTEYYAARAIQRAFKRAITDPEYAMCRTRLMREFDSLAHDQLF